MMEYREGYISAVSHRGTAEEIEPGFYDLMLLTCGWESRSIAISRVTSIQCNRAAIICFHDASGRKGYEPAFLEALTEYAGRISGGQAIDVIEHNSSDLDGMAIRLVEKVVEVRRKVGKPIRVVFDISSCPRYYFLYFLGVGMKGRLCESVTFLYSEGQYESEGEYEKEVVEYVATTGEWNTVPIPGFDGIFNPEGRAIFLVSVGFEGARYRSVVTRYEPDRVLVLLPAPGFNEKYTRRAEVACMPLVEEFRVADDDILRIPAGDAVAVWRAVSCAAARYQGENVTYLAFGPKPHVLGLGLHGIVDQSISVLYRKPEGYTRKEVKPTGVMWSYALRNLALA